MSDSRMVSVPRELLEKIEKSWRVPDGCPKAIWDGVNIIIRTGLEELREILAAPAEDVRAVGEEPFGYWCHPKGNPALGFFHKTIETNTSSFCDVMPLYHHPQRPVVLPERLDET